jgi:hypothetical protein
MKSMKFQIGESNCFVEIHQWFVKKNFNVLEIVMEEGFVWRMELVLVLLFMKGSYVGGLRLVHRISCLFVIS